MMREKLALIIEINLIYVNKKAGEFLGRSPESLVGKNIWTEFPEGIGRHTERESGCGPRFACPLALTGRHIPDTRGHRRHCRRDCARYESGY